MKSFEHRGLGDEASAGAMVNVGGTGDGAFWLSVGDVVALSGDYFRPGDADPSGAPAGALFALAPIEGTGGTRVDSRDEIVCALKVAAVDEAVVDQRFEPGGRFGHFSFSPRADRSDVERTVRDRYLALAAGNDDHFVAPGRSDAATGSGFGSAPAAYHHLHCAALDQAWSLGRRGDDASRAVAREAAAQHYLTDSFAAGHLRTPVAEIRRYWKARHPGFWDALRRRVASDTADALRELSALIRVVPAGYLHRRTLSEVTARTARYPELSVGDLVARCLHDWDNAHGLEVEGGGVVYGDGHIDQGATRELALSAMRAGNDDVEVAHSLGASGRTDGGSALYDAVRHATGAVGDAFVAETRIPRPTAANPPQHWQAPDAETLWKSPVVGECQTTVGEALTAMLEPAGQFIRQLDGLGQGLGGTHGIFAVPLLGPWLTRSCCHAFHDGFVVPLSRDPRTVVFDLVGTAQSSTGRGPY